MTSSQKILGFLIIYSVLLVFPLSASALSAFDPHFIISDSQMRNNSNWSENDIQSFLQSKGSYLSKYSTVDVVDDKSKTAAGIIHSAAERYDIDPKVLLVTLQKEQSLIDDADPTSTQLDWATGYAVCDSCSTSDPKVLKHKGFATQVDDAAYTFDWYYKNKNAGNIKQMGVANSIDGTTVIPKTWATAFLYTYTPHLHGNENFWKIWQKWFSQNYPEGTLLKSASSSQIWLIQNGVKRKFDSLSALITRADPKLIITVPDTVLTAYGDGADIKLPNYSILKQNSNYYLLDYDTIRPFASYDVVKKLGYNPQEIVEVSATDISGYTTGKTITAEEYAPQGVIYKISDFSNQLYLVKNGVASPFLNEYVAKANYKDLTIETKTMADLKKMQISDQLINFKDGSLIKVAGSDDVYAIESGLKRKFESEKTFLVLGYSLSNVITVDRVSALMTPDGDLIYGDQAVDLSNLNLNSSSFAGDLAVNVKDLFGSKLPAYIVADYPSGQVISGKNIDTSRSIASFVKVLVANEVLAQGLDLNKTTVYETAKYNDDGYTISIANGAILKNKDILNAMLIGSYNNLSNATVGAVGLTNAQMVVKINARLKDWGADKTKITDTSGLDAGNVSTARDLLKIFTYITDQNTSLRTIMGKKRHDFYAGKQFSIVHTNSMSFDNVDYKVIATKTGFTDEAQSVLYLLIQSKKTNKWYSIVTLGDPNYANRFVESAQIAKWIANK
ncbi:MAG: hypothetical protein COU31_00680 [Candidatus Magasanikbacteria bacterium CG10_big_fil_rev_8_21_14_0_10_40_10]|uniref:Peptidase S11 D-alanyl-D-alanine carboxypeptidase A N-terminal domain-containing protein n=1 Tax=Candidatus Magasanikbacteria bacterium CG10_big_fil_rev_8_21_14_0_10_40_10 TaxID=1974648 RepID=A0A2M6W4X0_9BACT|nr:MAG: hypothetical protein COU31_00680 [Candidatus Magasanikbacteria bacterium CG10_big_fil_rev_8_21_14_0_10_40_10]